MASIGLVLGAGGIAGQAYHAGVLTALEAETGWDPRSARVIVGTSAGSITATLLRSGVPAGDLAAWTTRAPLSVEGAVVQELFGEEFPKLEPLRVSHLLRRPSLPGLGLVRRVALRPGQPPGAALLLTLLAPGRMDIASLLDPLQALDPPGWHAGDLWICAVRRRDGRRVVFGQAGAPAAPLHLAVSASCAVPGYFAPVVIDDVAYVDGGVHSPTNAAILRAQGLKLAVVVSPMSGSRRPPTDTNAVVSRHAGIRLRLEMRALRQAGIDVIEFEPGPAEHDLIGGEWMSRHNVAEITRAAFDTASNRLRRPDVAGTFARAGVHSGGHRQAGGEKQAEARAVRPPTRGRGG
jgi:NTE family protein